MKIIKLELDYEFEWNIKFAELIANDEEIANLLQTKTYVEQGTIYRAFLNLYDLEHRNYSEKLKLAIKYFEDIEKKDEGINILLIHDKLLENRTYEEQVELINKYIESGKDPLVYYIIINEELLANRTCEEQIKLIDEYLVNPEAFQNQNESIEIGIESENTEITCDKSYFLQKKPIRKQHQ